MEWKLLGQRRGQRKYVLDLLKEIRMSGSRPTDTPIDSNYKLGDDKEGYQVNTTKYQKLMGKLIYLSIRGPILHLL